MEAGLVDDITVSVVPVLLGDGIRLFATTGKDVRLDLAQSRSFESGLVQNEYRVAAQDDAQQKAVLDELRAEAEKLGLGY